MTSDVEDDDNNINITKYITDEEEFTPGSPSNRLSNTQVVTLGQNNRQPGDTLEVLNKEENDIIDGTSNTTDMPDYASVSQFGGEVVLHKQVIYGRSQDINDEAIYAQQQGFTSNNDRLVPGSTKRRIELIY